MTKTTLALLSALAIGGVTLPAYAAEPAVGGTAAHASEGVPGAASTPSFGGGWAGAVSGEAGGAFDARHAAPIYAGGQPVAVTGEAGGGFLRDLAVRLGAQDDAERALAAPIAAQQG